MFDQIFAYAEGMLSHWWWLVTGLIPEAFEAVSRFFPSFRERLNETLSEKTRRKFELIFVAGAVFIAGFLAWRDERNARTLADTNYNNLLSKGSLNLSGASRLSVGISDRDAGAGVFKVRYTNNGQIPAQLYQSLSLITYSDTPENGADAPKIMKNMEDNAFSIGIAQGKELEILPNYWQSFSIPAIDASGKAVPDQENYQKFEQGSKYVNLKVIAVYRDEALLAENKYRLVRYCVSYTRSFSEAYLCPGENRTIVVTR